MRWRRHRRAVGVVALESIGGGGRRIAQQLHECGHEQQMRRSQQRQRVHDERRARARACTCAHTTRDWTVQVTRAAATGTHAGTHAGIAKADHAAIEQRAPHGQLVGAPARRVDAHLGVRHRKVGAVNVGVPPPIVDRDALGRAGRARREENQRRHVQRAAAAARGHGGGDRIGIGIGIGIRIGIGIFIRRVRMHPIDGARISAARGERSANVRHDNRAVRRSGQ